MLSCVRLFATPGIAARQASLSITNSQSSLRLTSIESVMPSSHLILCRPLLLLPPNPSQHQSFPMSQLFAWGGQSTGVSALASFLPKKSQGWALSQWTGWTSLQSKGLSSLLQHHSSKASILQCSAFFTVQLLFSHRQQLFHFLCVQLYQIHIALPIMKSLQCLGVGLFGFILFLILCSSCT